MSEQKEDILITRIDLLTDMTDNLSKQTSTLFKLILEERNKNNKLKAILAEIFLPLIISKCDQCNGKGIIQVKYNNQEECVCVKQIKQLKEIIRYE